MVAELYVRAGAAYAILAFVLAGCAACALWLWWLWATLWECRRCGKVMRECRCDPRVLL